MAVVWLLRRLPLGHAAAGMRGGSRETREAVFGSRLYSNDIHVFLHS